MKIIIAALAAFLCLPLAALAAEQTPQAPTQKSSHVKQMIIKYRDEPGEATLTYRMNTARDQGAQRRINLSHVRQMASRAHVLKFDRWVSTDEAKQLAREIEANDPNVEYAEPDVMLQPQLFPSDPQFVKQWSLFETPGGINAMNAWDTATGSGVVIAVLDTGYLLHEDLVANLLSGYDFISDSSASNDGDGRDSDATDSGDAAVVGDCGTNLPPADSPNSWHGTQVSGVAAAAGNNSVGITGIAFNAKILPVRVIGKCGAATSDSADAIIWASGGAVPGVPTNTNPAKVLNLSFNADGPCSNTTQNAINTARNNGAIVVVSAGNDNRDATNTQIAGCSGAFVVASNSRAGGKAGYSNYGSVVALAAPGGDGNNSANDILTTFRFFGADNYSAKNGTSISAPMVVGAAALMLSANTSLTADQVMAILKQTVSPFPTSQTCSGCGSGILNVSAAVAAASIQKKHITSVWTGRQLTASGPGNNAPTKGQPYTPAWNTQEWAIEPVPNSTYVRLRNTGTNTYLNCSTTAENAIVETYASREWSNQQWIVEDVSATEFRLKSVFSGKYLTIRDGSDYSGIYSQALVPMWPSQKWRKN
jgi:serine protease